MVLKIYTVVFWIIAYKTARRHKAEGNIIFNMFYVYIYIYIYIYIYNFLSESSKFPFTALQFGKQTQYNRMS